jgi:enoyl-CoA hydratase/carnithine racemase
MADDDAVLLDIDGPIATVTLNRPDRLNAWSWEMGMALTQRVETIAADRDVRVVVLKGAGRSFFAWIDLKPDVRDRIVGRSPASTTTTATAARTGARRHRGDPQPIIVALHGHRLGAGFETRDALPTSGSPPRTACLAAGERSASRSTAGLDLRLAGDLTAWAVDDTARRFDAALAHRLGLVQEVHPADALFAKAHELAAEIAANAPLAVQATKRTIDMFADQGLDDALRFEAMNAAVGFVSEDLVEGFAAGREKRSARFEGK